MEFNLMSTDTVYPNINIVFDDSLYAVSDDTVFVCSVGQRFNSKITFPSYADSIRIGGSPISYNQPLVIPNNVTNVSYLFNYCRSFNCPVTLNSGITNCAFMFSRANNFNAPVTANEGITTLAQLFETSVNTESIFNQPMNIPESVTNCARMFFNCSNFNQPINIPDNVYDYNAMFSYCSNFNSPINIAKQNTQIVSDATNMFYGCYNFNQPVNVPDNTIIYCLFYGCNNFNQPFNIPNNTTTLYQTFRGCLNFNQPINVPNAVVNMVQAFWGCFNLDSKITFENNTPTNDVFIRTFEGCYSFNKNVVFPNGTNRLEATFCNCTTFNASVVIPPTTNNTYQMYWNVNSCQYNFANSKFNTTPSYQALRSPIYFFANNIAVGGAQQMFSGCNTVSELYIIGITNNYQLNMFLRNNGINRCNIYTDDASLELLRTTPMLVGGTKPTWTSDTANGCIYNTTANIYIYNNWDGTLPTI